MSKILETINPVAQGMNIVRGISTRRRDFGKIERGDPHAEVVAAINSSIYKGIAVVLIELALVGVIVLSVGWYKAYEEMHKPRHTSPNVFVVDARGDGEAKVSKFGSTGDLAADRKRALQMVGGGGGGIGIPPNPYRPPEAVDTFGEAGAKKDWMQDIAIFIEDEARGVEEEDSLGIEMITHIAKMGDFISEQTIPRLAEWEEPPRQSLYFGRLDSANVTSKQHAWLKKRNISFFNTNNKTIYFAEPVESAQPAEGADLLNGLEIFDSFVAANDAYTGIIEGGVRYNDKRLKGFGGMTPYLFEAIEKRLNLLIPVMETDPGSTKTAVEFCSTKAIIELRTELEFTDEEAIEEAEKLTYRFARWLLYSRPDLSSAVTQRLIEIVRAPYNIDATTWKSENTPQ